MRTPPEPVLFDLAVGRRLRQQSLSAEVCEQVVAHKLAGLLVTRIKNGDVRVPTEMAAALESRDAMNRLHHAKQLDAIAEVTRTLDELDLPHLYIRGVTTSERWYDRPGERPSMDVAVALSPLRPHKWVDAVAALSADHPAASCRLDPQDLLNDLALRLPLPSGINLDVHFDVLRYGLPASTGVELWRRRRSLKLSSGQEVAVLDPEGALIEALLELNRDGFRYLKGFADVARMLAAEEIDWSYIDRLVTREGIREPTFMSLRTVVETLELHPPPAIKLQGWRVRLWRLAWPRGRQLQGNDGAFWWRHRQHLLAFFPRGRRLEATRRWVETFAPPRWRPRALHATVRSPHLWRSIGPQLKRMRGLRKVHSRVEQD